MEPKGSPKRRLRRAVEDETQDMMVNSDYYYRLQPRTLSASTSRLDNASRENIQKLKDIAGVYVGLEETRAQLDELAILLQRERPKERRRYVGPGE
jgi:hypothetical protein